MSPYTEVRISLYSGDIGQVVRKYSDKFMPWPFGRPDNPKLLLPWKEGDDFYHIIVDQSETVVPHYNYNIIVSVTGTKEERTKQIMGDLEEKLEIKLREAPDFLRNLFGTMSDI